MSKVDVGGRALVCRMSKFTDVMRRLGLTFTATTCFLTLALLLLGGRFSCTIIIGWEVVCVGSINIDLGVAPNILVPSPKTIQTICQSSASAFY